MAETVSESVVDCRNMICPKPIAMVKRTLAETPIDRLFEVIVNDDSSKENVLKYCWNHGQEVIRSFENGPDFHVVVKKCQERKVDAPLPVIGPCGTRWD